MRLTVHYMTQVKLAVGHSTEEIDTPQAGTLREFLQMLAGRHAPAFRVLLLDEKNEPHRSLLFFVGEEHAELTRPLRDGDAITILAPMSGG